MAFLVGREMNRMKIYPLKYNIYWDASIPMEYYEDEFLEFEEYLLITDDRVQSTSDNPHAKSDYFLDRFAKYEKWQKSEDRKEKQRLLRAQKKKAGKNSEKTNEYSQAFNCQELGDSSVNWEWISSGKC